MHPAYTEEELRRFEEELAAREAELNARAQRLSQETEALGRSQDRLEAQKRELQQVPAGRAGKPPPRPLGCRGLGCSVASGDSPGCPSR